MKPEEIIDMAKQSGIEEAYSLKHNQYLVRFKDGSLEVFAKLIAEAEREACANVCDELFVDVPPYSAPDCAAAIRARGQA